MPGPYPLPTLAAIVDGSGIWAPAYVDILNSLVASYQSIFGSDVYLDPDSQDGQWLAILAKAIFDANQAMVATYNAFSPATALGNGLSSVIKINGLLRQLGSVSTVPVDLIGETGAEIRNGVVGDANSLNRWDLPPTVVIPYSGVITVTATCQTAGAVLADIGTIDTILTPQPGWQTVSNRFTAAPGLSVENDYRLRQRQSVSTAAPAQAILAAILANVYAVPGVSRASVYENDSDYPDANGLPEHSIAVVAAGGDTQAIGTAITVTKPPGSYSYGNVAVTVFDSMGVEHLMRYFPLNLVTITVEVVLAPLDNWLSLYASQIAQNVSAFLTALPIGYDSYLSKLIAAAQLPEPPGLTYDIVAVRQRRDHPWFSFDIPNQGFDLGWWQSAPQAGDIAIAFDEAAFAQIANVSVLYQLTPPSIPG